MAYSIEQMLAARLFLTPQVVGDRVYFLSNLGQGGHLSLYAMNAGGSVPEALLPTNIALQNPKLMQGMSFVVFPKLGRILVMIDHDGDEHYQPMFIPLEGGVPRLAFDDRFANFKIRCMDYDLDRNIAYLHGESTIEPMMEMYQADLDTGGLRLMGKSPYGSFLAGVASDHSRAIMVDGYGIGDTVLYDWQPGYEDRHVLFGVPMEQRDPANPPKPIAIGNGYFTEDKTGLIMATDRFSDTFGLAYLDLRDPVSLSDVSIVGTRHSGAGEMETMGHTSGNHYTLAYNIDGCSWLYEATYDNASRTMQIERVICGETAPLANGVLEDSRYDHAGDRFALAFSTATSPCQIMTVSGAARDIVTQHTRERILGIPESFLSAGEDASFTSFDGLRVSARLYLPSPTLDTQGPYPLVYYIHGGPQGQERPDFTWFSMPLIQFFTLNGFAVFVPNVRGSTGYGLAYSKMVERDWGGQDRLDHVHAMTQVLPHDSRLDLKRAGVMGRSYGGFMTLTLASRHPDLWAAAIDMFGPYDLLTMVDRVPPTWRTFMALSVGDPEKDRDMLIEHSPRTYFEQIRAPMLVIQGKNDPRVIEQESHDVVAHLQNLGKTVDYLMFEDEGHDVLKYVNRVTCYSRITDFFKQHLGS